MTLTDIELKKQLKPFEFAGRKASVATLQRMLPNFETALFFGKVFKLDYKKLSELISAVFPQSDIIALLNEGGHSEQLQDYIIETFPEAATKKLKRDDFVKDEVQHAELLPAFWDAVDLKIAASIAKVAEELANVLDALPSKIGHMTFQTLAKVNRQRPTIGTYEAGIQHARVQRNLVIFDVSGSMSEPTVRRLADEVVGMAWNANAALAIVSNTTQYWEPGTFSTQDVLDNAEYGGTRYETLKSVLDQDWGTVITIADYDSASAAKHHIKQHATGHIGKVLDISLVNQPTYLAECVGQLADEVEPMLVATSYHVLSA